MPQTPDYNSPKFWAVAFQLTPAQASLAIVLANTPINFLPEQIRGQVNYAMIHSLLDVLNGVPRIIAEYVRLHHPAGEAT